MPMIFICLIYDALFVQWLSHIYTFRPVTVLKRAFNTGVFLFYIAKVFYYKHLFYRYFLYIIYRKPLVAEQIKKHFLEIQV